MYRTSYCRLNEPSAGRDAQNGKCVGRVTRVRLSHIAFRLAYDAHTTLTRLDMDGHVTAVLRTFQPPDKFSAAFDRRDKIPTGTPTFQTGSEQGSELKFCEPPLRSQWWRPSPIILFTNARVAHNRVCQSPRRHMRCS